MPDPQTKQSQIRYKLAEYLTQETTQFYSDINWLYYYQEHDSSMPPMGAIFIDRINGDTSYPFNIDNCHTCYKIHLRLKISRDTLLELLDSLDNWSSYLKDRVLKKLQIEGYQDYFKGIHLDPKQEIVIQVDKNQDSGGCGNLHIFLIWDDDGLISTPNLLDC